MWSLIEEPRNLSREFISLDAVIRNKVIMMNRALDSKQLREAYKYRDPIRTKNSLALEGTKITEDNIETIYNGGSTINVNTNTFLEAVNMKSAIDIMYYYLDRGQNLTEGIMLRLHLTLSNGLLDSNNSGKYRDCVVTIGRGNYQVAAINQTNKLVKQLFNVLYTIRSPLLRATFFSYTLVSIHPFKDYNGRLSRLCESYILMQSGYPSITIDGENRTKYMRLIRDAQESGHKVNWEYTKWIGEIILETIDSVLYSSPEHTELF